MVSISIIKIERTSLAIYYIAIAVGL